MADTIQVLEGLFATPVIVEDESGRAVAGLGGLRPTFSNIGAAPTPTKAESIGLLVLLGAAVWWILR